MKPEVERLISLAKSGNRTITDKQKEIILHEAKRVGDNLAEIEVILESLSHSSFSSQCSTEKKRRCPNCGAVISDNFMSCPECGYVFTKESSSGVEMRDYIREFERKLKEIDSREDIDFKEKDILKSSLISTFVVPSTKESLIQLFTYSYGNYVGTKDIEESVVAPAWLGRARNAYLLLKSQPTIDMATKTLLDTYSFVEDIKFKQKKEFENTGWFILLIVVLCLGVFAMIVLDSIFGG